MFWISRREFFALTAGAAAAGAAFICESRAQAPGQRLRRLSIA